MRNMMNVLVLLLCVAGIVVGITLGRSDTRQVISQISYPALRTMQKYNIEYKVKDYDTAESQHFVIKYRNEDKQYVSMVLDTAEKAYQLVTGEFNYAPEQKTLLVMHSDRETLSQAFGWSSGESAMGVYWAGVIQILSPGQWVKGDNPQEVRDKFERTGPLAHEYTHLVVDHILRGNYPLWFTEGMAQYTEYKLYGYQWRTTNNGLHQQLYSMDELANRFEKLPNQALAYRQSLMAVRYIAENYGDAALNKLLTQLQQGQAFPQALQVATGLDMTQFEQAWQSWAKDME